MARETVLVFCAHNDDQVFGAGGTLAKYAQQKKKIITVIFSYGEKSHPWLQKEITVDMRLKESERACKVLGCQDILYLGLDDQKVAEQIDGDAKKKLIELIKEKKPSKIFMHSQGDPHPDHRAVYNTVLNILDKLKYKCDVYSFEVWNPLKIKRRDELKLVVDISDTFKTKIKAVKCHKSQKITIFSLLWSVYLKDFINGLNNSFKFAEVFSKIR